MGQRQYYYITIIIHRVYKGGVVMSWSVHVVTNRRDVQLLKQLLHVWKIMPLLPLPANHGIASEIETLEIEKALPVSTVLKHTF